MKFRLLHIALFAFAIACSSSKQTKDDTSEMSDQAYSDAMEKEHSDEKPDASGAEEQASGTVETTGSEVMYGTVDGVELTGYLAEPAAEGDYPAVIVIHEWWGLNDNIKTMADKLASHGYRALAVDMYGDNVATTHEKAKEYMQQAMENPDEGVANLIAARTFLEEKGAEQIGVIGWCFGGGWSLTAGLTQSADLDAIVMYYGRVKTSPEELAPLKAPLLGIFAAEDQGIPLEQVKEFEEVLAAAGKDAKIHIYDGVGHAFANPSGDAYAKGAAEDAWEKTIAFFSKHLKDAS